MRMDPLKQYTKLRQQLTEEKNRLEARLEEINSVLAPMGAASSLAAVATTTPRAKARGKNKLSMKDAITQALRAHGPMGRKELAEAVREVGYVSKAKDPLSSMGIVLYAKNSPFKRREGKFCLTENAPAAEPPAEANGRSPKRKKRTMSPEARAKIAAAQRARWAKVHRSK